MKRYLLYFILLCCADVRAQLYNGTILSNKHNILDDRSNQWNNKSSGTYLGGVGGAFNHTGPAQLTFVNDGVYTATQGHTDAFLGYFGTGTGDQEISGAAAPDFFNLSFLNGPASAIAVTNLAGIRISGTLDFQNGLTTTDRANPLAGAVHFLPGSAYTSSAGNSIATPADAQYVNGYVNVRGAGSFTFPVGSQGGNDSRPLAISGLSLPTDEVSVAYWAGDPGSGDDPTGGAHPNTTVGPGLQSVSQTGFWDWNAVSGSGPVTVTLSLPASYGYTNAADVRLAGWHIANARWEMIGAGAASGTAENSTITATLPSMSAYSALTVGSITQNPLPVTLLNDVAVTANTSCTAMVRWHVANEQDMLRYAIQRSPNGADFKTVGEQQPQAGNSSAIHEYEFSDNSPLPGLSYYRIAATGIDGSVQYTSIARLIMNCGASDIRVFPTQPADLVEVILPEGWKDATVRLFSAVGQVVTAPEEGRGTTHRTIRISALASGNYLLQVSGIQGAASFKLIKTN